MEDMDTRPEIPTKYRYFDLIGMCFVASLLISNTVGVKLIQIGPFSLPGGIYVFPITYIFGDILTEVYGYRASRRIIWTGLGLLVVMSLVYALVGATSPAPFWSSDTAYSQILGQVPRIVLASALAYFCGEFSNSYLLAKMKVWTEGKHLWTRTIGSTLVGEGVDTCVFVLIAFAGTIPASAILAVIASNYVVKVVYEVIATPVTYRVVGFLKSREGVDTYDRDTDFNPFRLR